MSKFDRYKKKEEIYIYPHTHCEKCGAMIEGSHKYCSECYEKMNQKKKRKWFRFKRQKKSQN
jgi:predicted nucleic acid-binding Zn ribbon protein